MSTTLVSDDGRIVSGYIQSEDDKKIVTGKKGRWHTRDTPTETCRRTPKRGFADASRHRSVPRLQETA